jgi:aminoglycoside phosphotransferase (APT) family kinase protein
MEFDPQRLEIFLKDKLPDLQGAMQLERIGGGQSNPTFFVSFDNRQLVLRKQPNATLLPSAHAVDREYRVMQALSQTDVPVPRMVLFHAERDIVGTPFYMMARLPGRVFSECALPGMKPEERRSIYMGMAEAMAALHQVKQFPFSHFSALTVVLLIPINITLTITSFFFFERIELA